MQKYEIPQNCPFSLPFPTVIAFHRVKKSPLIIGIVDRIKTRNTCIAEPREARGGGGDIKCQGWKEERIGVNVHV